MSWWSRTRPCCRPTRAASASLTSVPDQSRGYGDELGAIVVLVGDDVPALPLQCVQALVDRLPHQAIDRGDRLRPLGHVERADHADPGLERRMRRDRLCVDDEASWDQRAMDLARGVYDALRLDASQRPAAQREVEATPLHVERVRVVDAEGDALAQLARKRRLGLERAGCGEPRQAPFTAADLQHPRAIEVRDFEDRGRLDAVGIAQLHHEDDTANLPLNEETG